MYLRAIRTAVAADNWPAAVHNAVAYARAFPGLPDHSKRIADMSLRAFDWAEAMGRWDDAVRFAGQATKALPRGFAELRRVANRLQQAGAPAGPADGKSQSGPMPHRDDLGKAEHLGNLIRILEELIADQPEAFPAFNAVASLLLVRAAHLTNGNRPSQALLELARARAYHPTWEQPEKIEPLIAQKLHILKTNAAQFHQKLSPTMQRMIPELVEADAGTGPRDRFLASGAPETIRQRRFRARALWLWSLAGLPGGREALAGGRATAFAEAYDLLLASGIKDYADMVRKWDEIRVERPAPPLGEVTPQHLVALILNEQPGPKASDVPDGPEPADEQLDALEARLRAEYDDPALHIPAESLPRLSLTGTLPEVRGSDEPFAFWWFSRRTVATKLALAAGIGLVAVSAALWWQELSSRPRRDRAFSDLRAALTHLDGPSARQAVSQFRSAMTLPWVDPRIAIVKNVERELVAWRPSLHERDSAYERVVTEARGGDEPAVAHTAEAFLAIDPDAPDPRRGQVHEILATLRARADRRTRDAAYVRLTPAVERGDDSGVIQASEQFLVALPARTQDPRGEQVLDWYSGAFARWFARRATRLRPRSRRVSNATSR